jgi:predicted glycosyl hydrolase (DUF1957 family)
MERLISRYVEKWESGQIEISTSPSYHPILPLLIDSDIGARSSPGIPLPPRFAHPDDALKQLQDGMAYCHEVLGRAPRGLWPSEGAVAPEIIPLVEEAGFSWVASDEAILFGSLGGATPHCLYEPYSFGTAGSGVSMVFRHHELSDLIGFVYRKNDADIAVTDFLARLKEIRRELGSMPRPPLVTIILDGENPWEYYPDGGRDFLSGLYDRIAADPDLELVTVGEYLDRYPPTRSLPDLHSGSWINGDFGIWIGGDEENRAWEVLGRARNALGEAVRQGHVSDQAVSQAREAILAAEGSDWFWWYGEQFFTEYAYEFDDLFRSFLQHAYRLLDRPVPDELLNPLRNPRPAVPTVTPTAFIHPQIDGRLSYYWEWAGAGSVGASEAGGTMHRGETGLAHIAYGFDLGWCYLRLDPREAGFRGWGGDVSIHLVFDAPEVSMQIVLGLRLLGDTVRWDCRVSKDGQDVASHEAGVRCAVDELAEVAIPFPLLDVGPREVLTFRVETVQDELIKERFPREGYIELRVPDEDFERKLWLV